MAAQTEWFMAYYQWAKAHHINPTLAFSLGGIAAVGSLRLLIRNYTRILRACIGYREIKTIAELSPEALTPYASVFPFLTAENYATLAREFPALTPAQVNTLIHGLQSDDRLSFESIQSALGRLDPGTLARYRAQTANERETNRHKKLLVDGVYWLTVLGLFYAIFLKLSPVISTFRSLPAQLHQFQSVRQEMNKLR